MKTYKYEGDIDILRRWAVNRGEGAETVRNPPEPFRSWVANLMPEDCRNTIGYWVGVVTPENEVIDGWVRGYPHAHVVSVNWDPGVFTAVTYLSVADEGGEFGLGGLSKDDPYEFIEPEEGTTVVMDALTWHGVKPVKKGTRIALVTSGCPE